MSMNGSNVSCSRNLLVDSLTRYWIFLADLDVCVLAGYLPL